MPNNLQNWNRDYGEVEYFYDRYYGPVSSQHAVDRNSGQMHFRDAILQALDISSFHLVTFRDSTVAIYYDNFNDVVHLFDSHQRDQYGVSSPNGNAVLLTFESLEEFIRYTISVYGGYQFEITPVRF